MKRYFQQNLYVVLAKLVVIAVCSTLLTSPVAADAIQFKTESIRIHTQSSIHQLSVEIAQSPSQLAQGLMFRQSLPENRGMLFNFGEEKQVYMWMKNTLIPLDMVFLNRYGRIVGIRRQTLPRSEAIITISSKAKAVLELNAGMATKLGLTLGDRIIHSMFD